MMYLYTLVVALFTSENSVFVGWASWKPAAVDIVNQNLSFLRRAAFLSKEDLSSSFYFIRELSGNFGHPGIQLAQLQNTRLLEL